MSLKLNAGQLRKFNPKSAKDKKPGLKTQEIYVILDNVLDTYNIGAIFRLADAVAAKKIYLCGATSTPPNHKIKKSSINTTEWTPWEYSASASEAISELKLQVSNLQVVAVEQSDKSIPFDRFEYSLPIALIVGNETTGVSKEVLDICDGTVELPMFGVNISLNVMVSLGIVLYHVISVTSLAYEVIEKNKKK
jgi:23S rRNA (guanosine2251-2'-O)-methyltransferase